jgi:hypothetical protein
MGKRLEDFIKNNQDEFNDLEPRANLWEKIEQGLPQQFKKSNRKSFSLGFVLRMAAILIIGMGISFILYVRNERKNINLAEINPEYAKQQAHYVSLIASKRSELKAVSKSDPQLYREFSGELSKMDSIYKKLNHDLPASPNPEEVLHAMIRNLQIQTEVLNQQLNVIEHFNKMKKDEKNEIKSI